MNRYEKLALGCQVGALAIALGFWGALGFITYHFLSRLW